MTAEEVIAGAIRDDLGCDDCGLYPSDGYTDRVAWDVVAALKSEGYAVVELPKHGELSDHHDDDCRVWYFGQNGEYLVFDDDNAVIDPEGFEMSPEAATEMSSALLAAALAAGNSSGAVAHLEES